MKKDADISKLFKEAGIIHAPEGFAKSVMDRIEAEPERKSYKPLIGRTGRIVLILFIAGIVAVSLLYSSPGDSVMDPAGRLSSLKWQWPTLNLNLDFLENFSLSPWIISTVVALFLLVLSDAGLRRRKIF